MLALAPDSGQAPNRPTRAPIHASFSSTADVLAVLWESGYVEWWDLNTRLALGTAKVMAPVLTQAFHLDRYHGFRQVSLLQGGCIALLCATDSGNDFVRILTRHGKGDSSKVSFPSMNGRLVNAENALIWQANDGELFGGLVHSQITSAELLIVILLEQLTWRQVPQSI
jgi:elongator complex protein 1